MCETCRGDHSVQCLRQDNEQNDHFQDHNGHSHPIGSLSAVQDPYPQQDSIVGVHRTAPLEELPRSLDIILASMQHRGRCQQARIVWKALQSRLQIFDGCTVDSQGCIAASSKAGSRVVVLTWHACQAEWNTAGTFSHREFLQGSAELPDCFAHSGMRKTLLLAC